MISAFFRLLVVLLMMGSVSSMYAQRERLTPEEIEVVEKKWPGTKKTSTGIRYIIQQEGTGDTPKPGDRVKVLYKGTLIDGTKFDERVDPQDPLAFRLGRQEVIAGWEQLLPLMRVNEKRLVIIPGSLAYGSRGRPPVIGRDATLVFEMQLVKIDPP